MQNLSTLTKDELIGLLADIEVAIDRTLNTAFEKRQALNKGLEAIQAIVIAANLSAQEVADCLEGVAVKKPLKFDRKSNFKLLQKVRATASPK